MLKTALFVLLLFVISGSSQAYANHANELLVLDKSIGNNEFKWSDNIEITVTLQNLGHVTFENFQLVDYSPTGFGIIPSDNISSELNKITKSIEKINPNETIQFTYVLQPLANINTDQPIDVVFPAAEIIDSDGKIVQKSVRVLFVTINPDKSWSENNLIFALLILLIISFGFGSFGALINWINADKKTKDEREINETKIYHYALLGGLAGVLALAGFEGMSVLFSGTHFQLDPITLLTLIGATIGAGWAPLAVINRSVKDLQKKNASVITTVTLEENENEDFVEKIKKLESKLEETKGDYDVLITEYKENIEALNDLVNQAKGD